MPGASQRRPAAVAVVLGLLVSNAIKLGGLWVAIHEIATQPQPRLGILAVAVFMMTGAQVSEEAVLRLVGRMFGASLDEPKSKQEREP